MKTPLVLSLVIGLVLLGLGLVALTHLEETQDDWLLFFVATGFSVCFCVAGIAMVSDSLAALLYLFMKGK